MPWAISYDEYYGLWLNAPRGLMQLAEAVRKGHEAAAGTGSLGDAWGDAMVRFEEEAEIATFNVNSQRAIARAMLERAAMRGM